MKYNFDKKVFSTISNSRDGRASDETMFYYNQIGHVVTAHYEGGEIEHGQIIATLHGDDLQMHYQCLTLSGELLSGKAVAKVSLVEGRIQLDLDWQWLVAGEHGGKSTYGEVRKVSGS